MIDINLIRTNPDLVKAALEKRGAVIDLDAIRQLDSDHNSLQRQMQDLRARRNAVSAEIPALKKQGKDISALQTEMRTVGDKIKEFEKQIGDVHEKLQWHLDRIPNLPQDDVPPGGKEQNQVLREFGKKPQFSFTPKDHVELATSLKLIDYERGVKVAGSGNWIYSDRGARLEWSLLNYFIENHLQDGYKMMMVPHLLLETCGYNAGQFPKFDDAVFFLRPEEGDTSVKFLLPTSETVLANLYAGEIIPEEDLPLKYFSYTPCYRREAGSYRTSERGMIRGHQFNKIEMFHYARPEDSNKSHDELVGKAERLVDGLGLHFRTSRLAAGDCSEAMAKTFDIEIWIPSMNEYKEVSSVSNACDYQARRGNIRLKRKDSGKNEFVHTLNASGLATSRLFPAILEQCQQADGSVVVPAALRKWYGEEIIRP